MPLSGILAGVMKNCELIDDTPSRRRDKSGNPTAIPGRDEVGMEMEMDLIRKKY